MLELRNPIVKKPALLDNDFVLSSPPASVYAEGSAGKRSVFIGETEAHTIFCQSGSKNISSTIPRTKLYRAVNENELAQMHQTKKIEQRVNSLEGKFFAESYADAKKWGDLMNGKAIVIEVDIPTTVLNELQHWKKLDGIGPARYALLEQLENAIVKIPHKINFSPEPKL